MEHQMLNCNTFVTIHNAFLSVDSNSCGSATRQNYTHVHMEYFLTMTDDCHLPKYWPSLQNHPVWSTDGNIHKFCILKTGYVYKFPMIKYTIYAATVKHSCLLCLQLKVHTWRPVSIKHDHHQAIFMFIQILKQYMDWDASAAVNCTRVITKWVFIIFMYGITLHNVLRPIIINRRTVVNNQLKSYKIIKNHVTLCTGTCVYS